MADVNQSEYFDTSEFLEPEDTMEISSEFTDITPIAKKVVIAGRNECETFMARRYGQWWTLKCVSKSVVDKARVYEYLRKEFVVGISLWHPNIVRMISLQADLVDGAPGIVLEYVDGVTLDEFLATRPPLTERVKVAGQMISAMRYYMAKQVVHCDLKPANILITHNGHNVKIIDFGLADIDNFNVFKGHAGTDRFAAPEQKSSDGVVDCRSDIYAFGHILKMLHLPLVYDHIARKCLKENPDERYQNPVDLFTDFENAKTSRLSKWTVVTVLLGVLIAVGTFFMGYWASVNIGNRVPVTRDKIIGGKLPALFFADTVDGQTGVGQTYVVQNSADLLYLPNSRPIPGGVSPDSAVDLGLSVKWAPFNVGSDGKSANHVGGYYNWGDPSGKNIDGESKPYTLPQQRNDIAVSQLDIATSVWGNGWRMPTSAELMELADRCRWTLVSKRGSVQGYQVKGPSGKSIFLPFAGYRRGPSYFKQGVVGCYWSATPYAAVHQAAAFFLQVDCDVLSVDQGDFASAGYSVRPVLDK